MAFPGNEVRYQQMALKLADGPAASDPPAVTIPDLENDPVTG